VYGTVQPALDAWCARRGVGLHHYDWCDACQAAGFARDAAYLVRPDGYVALADSAQEPQAFDDWFATRGIRPA
jgi:hypothetical protein